MTYEINIQLADLVGRTLDIAAETEEAIDNVIYTVLHHHETIDVNQLLAEHHAIAQVWDVSHIRDQRPDLTDEQAWEVLQECDRSWDRLSDPMLATIRQVAKNLFPNPRGKAALRATLRRIERQIEALPEDECTDPAAYGSVGVELDTLETLTKGA
jgi:hypothetical protein